MEFFLSFYQIIIYALLKLPMNEFLFTIRHSLVLNFQKMKKKDNEILELYLYDSCKLIIAFTVIHSTMG